jgi:type I restriction enzyme S subunit
MSFPRYQAYKPSGVEWLGEVPEHWEALRLRFVVALNPSKQEAKEFGDHEVVSFLPMEAIGEDGSLRLEHEKQVAECLSGYTYFRDGDVCIAKITPCFENGKGAILCKLKGGIGFGTTELIVARPEKEKITKEFLDYLFRSQNFRRLGESEMYGAGGQKRVPDSFVRDFTAALPSIEEQNKVTTFLERETAKIDALIAEQQRLIELLQEKRQAVISHAVTKGLNPDAPMKDSGVEWLGEVPEHWEVLPIKHTCSLLRDGTHLPPARAAEGIPLLSVRNIQDNTFSLRDDDSLISKQDYLELSRSFVPEPDDVLLAIVGATMGKVAIVPSGFSRFHIQRSLAIFRSKPEVLLAKWLLYVCGSSGFNSLLWKYVGFSAQPGIYLGVLKDIRIPVPPKEEQEEIFARLDQCINDQTKILSAASHSVDLLQERRSALISAAVTGQIDLRGLVSEADAA